MSFVYGIFLLNTKFSFTLIFNPNISLLYVISISSLLYFILCIVYPPILLSLFSEYN